MKKISVIFAAALISMTAASGAHAFGIKVPGLGGDSKSAPAADLSGQQTALVKTYVGAGQTVSSAHAQFFDALGMKEDVAKAKATAEQLGGGATKDSLAASAVAISENTQALSDKLKSQPALDAKAKTLFGKGLLTLVKGVKQYVGMSKNVSDMSSSLSANPMAVTQYGSAVTVVKDFPNSLSKLKDSLKVAVDFAKTNDIPGTADATAALGDL